MHLYTFIHYLYIIYTLFIHYLYIMYSFIISIVFLDYSCTIFTLFIYILYTFCTAHAFLHCSCIFSTVFSKIQIIYIKCLNYLFIHFLYCKHYSHLIYTSHLYTYDLHCLIPVNIVFLHFVFFMQIRLVKVNVNSFILFHMYIAQVVQTCYSLPQ